MPIDYIGAGAFGLVIGWITYRTLRRSRNAVRLSDIATVTGAVGGGAVVALFRSQELFSAYAIGLAIGFFGYLLVAWLAPGAPSFMGDD